MTDKKDDALKLALEALKKCHYYMIDAGLPNQSLLNEAFTAHKALKEALAEQPAQQKPVGRLESDPYEGHVFVPRIDGDWSMLGKDLYTSPQPAQREWVYLTPEEVQAAVYDENGCVVGYEDYALAIETKLKEKNRG